MNRVSTLQSHVLPLKVLPEVQQALQNKKAVVALESTIISHGMPYPDNFKCALEVEDVVRQHGAVPATIAILDGVIHVGLSRSDLEKLATAKNVRKCSRRDIPIAVAQKEVGATTVSGTMMVANMVGIRVFVTGGIGGVHRHGESTMDISADLTELGRTPVAVVSAGVKSILDIPRTLEVLETQGVTVAVVGSNEFPAFFTRKSGSPAPLTVKSEKEAGGIVKVMSQINQSGALFAVPIPSSFEADAAIVDTAIQQALKEADEKKIAGFAITPFLLKRVNELTKGQSLKSNIALVKNNAKVGALIAVAATSAS
eukprot:PhF_6_TR33018/c0_g1_i1/m.48664/K16329/psuG; pseudouridylate synthase